MIEPEYYTVLVTVLQPEGRRNQVRESFASLGFSVREYVNDTGFISKVRFYVDYTNPGLLTVWFIKYAGLVTNVELREIIYP